MVQWLNSGHANENLIPKNASGTPFIEAYERAVHEPHLQAWFKSKGFKLATVRVFSDCVTGIVVRDGKEIFQRFSTTDGSGWGLAGRNISAAQNALSPNDLGMPGMPGKLQDLVPRDVLLDFYGVRPPLNEKSAPQLGKKLKKDGWPTISVAQREQWEGSFKQQAQRRDDNALRADLAEQLRSLIQGKSDSDPLTLDEHRVVAAPGSALDQRSNKARKQFLEFLASPAFTAFLKKTGFEEPGSEFRMTEFRLSEGDLQMRNRAGQWVPLQRAFDDEVSKVATGGSKEEQAAARKMNADYNVLVGMAKKTGNALYSTRTYDARQALAMYAPDAANTVGQLRATLGWLDTQLPQPPLARDYAGLTPYGPGGLSDAVMDKLKGSSTQVMALLKAFSGRWSGFESFPDPDSQLAAFFDSAQATALAETIAKSLRLYSVAEGQVLPKTDRHQLLAAALKLSVEAPVPGQSGTVAGYGLYQAGNNGRTLKEVRSDVETHLEKKGVDSKVSSLMAHLFLAQSAPEMLIKKDPTVPADTAQLLNQDPESIKVGSTGWLNLRLGCALVDSLGVAGGSRSLNFTQIMALSRLSAAGPEQETLIKQLATQPLLDWGVMTGIFPATSDGKYSPGDYEAASKAFTERENQTREAFATLLSESPTQTSLLVKQLALLFPEMTEEGIRNIKVERESDIDVVVLNNTHLIRPAAPRLLTDVILMNQAVGDPQHGLRESRVSGVNLKMSSAAFKERLKQLPMIMPLVAPAVDKYTADARAAQATALKLMIAQLPLEDRRALESGKIEFFSVRNETGEDVEADTGADSKVAKNKGTHGLLMRYETDAVEPRFGYFEVFPGSMKMVKRTDLPETLPLGGKVENGQKPFGPFAYVNAQFQKGTRQPFDFEAYDTGSMPRSGVQSQVIIERYGTALPDTPSTFRSRIPNSFVSSKTAHIVNRLQAYSFADDRAARIAHANEPTALHKSKHPYATSTLFTAENARSILSLIPYVGAIADLVDGKTEDGIKGLLIDLASFVATGGLAGAKSFAKGLRMLIPFSGKPFSMAGLKGAGTFFRGLFNPLESIPDIMRSGPNAINALKMVAKGQTIRLGANLYLPVKTFEQWRWTLGARDTLFAGSSRSASQWPGARMGASDNREVLAVEKNGAWYAINPISGKPEGAPLERFTPQAA
ncbi:hypothetical protein BFW87_24590 [Pseudomonas fluorescens]|uniref:Dermonecrotic toxin n=1 Tax=Pseudomonas fluorescens TaxID=294 RepID=A0A1T2Y3J0_PSEFL|nr:hypothetical protein BFW87_24590 [Pseudomonas fluorescens]